MEARGHLGGAVAGLPRPPVSAAVAVAVIGMFWLPPIVQAALPGHLLRHASDLRAGEVGEWWDAGGRFGASVAVHVLLGLAG
ncbi:hypothetical protein E1286_35135, partial [Nonomuraea terrae]